MSYCKKCGAPIKPGSSFCTRCGARLAQSPAAGGSGSKGGPRKPKRSRAPLWIVLGILLVALAVPGVLFLTGVLPPEHAPEETPEPSREADLQPVYAAAEPFENEDGSVPENRVQDAIDAVYKAARENQDVLSCEKDEYGVYMEVADGPDYVYCPMIEDMDAGGGDLEIITLQPYDTENREKARSGRKNYDLDAPDAVARALAAQDAGWRFSADVNDAEVTMDRIMSLSDYQVILWHGHGGYTKTTGYYLCTDIRWSQNLARRYGLDKSTCYRYGVTGKIGLRPAFFEQSFPDGAFNNAFIYLATCYSGKEHVMADTLLNKGAAVVFVNSESINRGYNLNMMHLIAESYLIGPGGETTQEAIQYLGGGYSYNTPDNWNIGDSLALAQFRYGLEDPHLFSTARVYYLCKDGMEHTPYAKWLEGFRPAARTDGRRLGVSDINLIPGVTITADVDFDGMTDTVSVTGTGRLQLQVDFGGGGSWQAELRVDAGGETPQVRLLSFTDGDYICYAFIADNPGSRYGGLSWTLWGQDYLTGASPVPLTAEDFPALDSWGGVIDNKWVVVVGEEVYGIPDPLYGELERMALEYGEPVLPIPYADGMSYELYARDRSDGLGCSLVLSRSCSSQMGYLECPGTVYAAYEMRSASQASLTDFWFEADPNYLYLMEDAAPGMIGAEPGALMPALNSLADGQYWAILYAEDDAFGSHVSNEIDIEDYICFSYEEIEALSVGDTLELSRFMPIGASINYRAYGYGGDPNPDLSIRRIERVHDEWLGDLIYINREGGNWDYVILQDWNGCWRQITDEDYIPMQLAGRFTLPFADDLVIRDQLTPVMLNMDDPGTPLAWEDPYDFFVFNDYASYYEAQITVKNGVITEIFIPYRP